MTSKLGIHIERRPPGWKEFVQRARPAIVKSMDLSIVDEWPEVIDQIGQDLGAEPNIFLLGRLSLAHQSLESPRKAAQGFVRELRKRLPHEHQWRAFDAIEGYNEVSYETADQLRALAAFEAEVGRLLKEEGVPFATGGFPTSWPNIPDWVDTFQEALQVADYFHIHEYSWPTMQTKQGGHCLRYRTLYGHMKDANLARPIIISECGLDKPKADDGWQTLQLEDIPEEIREEMLEQHNNEDDIIDAFYLTQLEWYDRELRQDDYVVGATIFTYGGIERWTTFDIHRRSQFRKDLTTYLAAQNTQPHARWTPGAAVTQPPPMPEGPAVRVEQAEITPTRLKPGETLHVTVVVRNIGTVPVNSFNEDNPPDNLFKEMDPVADAASPGTWRVGVDSDGHHHELDHPWRWGRGDPLQPGESRVVQGSIRLYCEGRRDFWIGLVEESVKWWDDNKGRRSVIVSAKEALEPDSGAVAFLPPPPTTSALAKQDPELYASWREHINAGFKHNNEMFSRVLEAFMEPYYTTIWMYRILFGVGIVSFLAAAGLSIWTRQASFALIFGGLSVAAFLTYFLSRPLRALEENLEFITWLGVVYNTYWTRLAYTMDLDTVQQDLHDITQNTVDEIERMIDKHAEMRGKRPGLR